MSSLGPVLAAAILFGAICIIGGARRLGTKVIIGSVAIAAILPVVICLVQQLAVSLAPVVGLLALFLVLALVGWIAWRRREGRARALEADMRRHGHPRRRAVLPPPPDEMADGKTDEQR